jgi:hypothetical protein
MMGGKTPETCWAVKNIRIIKWKIVASGWWFIWIVRRCTDLKKQKHYIAVSWRMVRPSPVS